MLIQQQCSMILSIFRAIPLCHAAMIRDCGVRTGCRYWPHRLVLPMPLQSGTCHFLSASFLAGCSGPLHSGSQDRLHQHNHVKSTCRYVYHTLKNSMNTVPTIAQADAIYVYDYCYVMWALGDHHARGHWWLKDNYNPERKAGHYLLSAYR